MSRIRVRFIKGESLKFLSHLDILRTFARALRRSNISVEYSKGFNPHMLMSFALPLTVGATSEGELVDINLIEDIKEELFIEKINKGLPEDLKVISVKYVDSKSNIMAIINSAKYEIKLYANNLSKIDKKVEELIARDEILIDKKTKKGIKEVDIKNKIRDIKILNNNDKMTKMYMYLDAGSVSNLKPELVIKSLEKYYDLQIDDFDVHRVELLY